MDILKKANEIVNEADDKKEQVFREFLEILAVTKSILAMENDIESIDPFIEIFQRKLEQIGCATSDHKIGPKLVSVVVLMSGANKGHSKQALRDLFDMFFWQKLIVGDKKGGR